MVNKSKFFAILKMSEKTFRPMLTYSDEYDIIGLSREAA